MTFETLQWFDGVDGYLEMIDQRRLPGEFLQMRCENTTQLWDAIKTLAVRGAPAIGVSAGYGVCLAMKEAAGFDIPAAMSHLEKSVDYLASSRPTAVNLFWALDRMKKHAADFIAVNSDANTDQLRQSLLAEANAICKEDKEMCRQIGINGEKFIKAGSGVLTHCNAGALATAGQGTALSPMYEAKRNGKEFTVYADETRPLLQGARLTAWELVQAKIDAVLICDNMAGVLMRDGKIDVIITGADRIAANGDAANKIGTFSLSILAKEYGIPFYIAAPSSTFDLNIKTGKEIPIEERDAEEVANFAQQGVAPDGVRVYNPAFDVTEACNITAIITEKGVIENPNTDKIAAHLGE